jgi:hypothetical protein
MKNVIKKILKEEFNDRISREDYLNKILDYLVEDTIIDFDENEIFFPIIHPTQKYIELRFSVWHPQRPTTLRSIDNLPELSEFPPLFSKYCKDNYGLTDEEIDYLLEKYTEIIEDKMDEYNDDPKNGNAMPW